MRLMDVYVGSQNRRVFYSFYIANAVSNAVSNVVSNEICLADWETELKRMAGESGPRAAGRQWAERTNNQAYLLFSCEMTHVLP